MRTKEILNARYDLVQKTISALEAKTKSFPEGSILVKHNKYGYYYYCVTADSIKYLNKGNIELIKQLVQKDYLNKALKAARQESEALSKACAVYPQIAFEDVFDNLNGSLKKYAKPLVPGDDKYVQDWLSKPFTPKYISKNAPSYYTLRGERVRSKSEVIIADRLYAKGIPYKYECPLAIGNEIIHPDFTILRLSDRKVVYHEHCGMMDKEDYAEDMVRRVKKYERAGVFLGDRLFLTLETTEEPIDIKLFDEFIEKNFR